MVPKNQRCFELGYSSDRKFLTVPKAYLILMIVEMFLELYSHLFAFSNDSALDVLLQKFFPACLQQNTNGPPYDEIKTFALMWPYRIHSVIDFRISLSADEGAKIGVKSGTWWHTEITWTMMWRCERTLSNFLTTVVLVAGNPLQIRALEKNSMIQSETKRPS